MIETKTHRPTITLMTHGLSDHSLEINRLLAAAVVNQQFCNLLLEDPALALASGYQGETFTFDNEERDLIQSIRAGSLADLANQLVRTLDNHQYVRANPQIQPADCFGY